MLKLSVLSPVVKYLGYGAVAVAMATSILMTVYYRGELRTSQEKLQGVTKELVKAESTIDSMVEQINKNEAELTGLRERKNGIDSKTEGAKQDVARIRQDNAGANPDLLPGIAERLRQRTDEVRANASKRP